VRARSPLARRLLALAASMPLNHPSFKEAIIDGRCAPAGYQPLWPATEGYQDIYGGCLLRWGLGAGHCRGGRALQGGGRWGPGGGVAPAPLGGLTHLQLPAWVARGPVVGVVCWVRGAREQERERPLASPPSTGCRWACSVPPASQAPPACLATRS
jgi:hypothetical protein